VLEKLDAVADHLPQIVQLGAKDGTLDYQAIAREMLGIDDTSLYAEGDLSAIQQRLPEIQTRIEQRSGQIKQLAAATMEAKARQGGEE
jgi:hypothetical protein